MLTIRVCSRATGKPVPHKKVFISFGSTWLEAYTDAAGDAQFDTYPRKGDVIVEGSSCYNGHLEGRTVVYI